MPPASQSNTDVVDGPRKRRPSERVTENGDPLVQKKAKTANNSSLPHAVKTTSGKKASTKASSQVHRATVEDIPEPPPVSRPQPQQPNRILEAADGSDEDIEMVNLPGLEPVSDEDEDEEADEEVEGDSDVDDEDDEAELAHLMKKWDAPVYAFFKPMPAIVYVANRKAHVFECGASRCRCKTRFVRRFLYTHDSSSTSNLRQHAKVCWGEEAVTAADDTGDAPTARDAMANLKDGSITAAFECAGKGKVSYSHRQHTKAEARAEFVRWVSESKRPFQIVNDRAFRSLMKTGRPEAYIPSAETVSRDVKNVFVRVREHIAKMLQAYVAITVHLEHEGKPLTMLLDIVEVAKSHTGVNLASAFSDILKSFGIDEKILSITADNASNNDTMVDELADILDDFPGAANQTRCFAHTLSISARAILKQFDVPKKKAGEALDEAAQALADLAKELDVDDRAEREERSASDDEDEPLAAWEDFRDGLTEEEVKELDLCKFSFAVKNSTTILLPEWFRILRSQRLSERMMPRDVSTRWNSTYDMLDFALKYRAAIDAMTATRDLDLRKYELVSAEWRIAGELRDVLKDATLFFLRATPNLATVIPAMDHIDKVLATCSDSPYQFSPAIRAALAIGKKALNKYYNKTDHSEVYRIAMVLHPRHKLEYFKKHGWEALWIDTARQIVREEFNRSYIPTEAEDAGSNAQAHAHTDACSTSTNIFDNLPDLAATSTDNRDELDRYLATDVEDVKDGLKWWYDRRSAFPNLSRMAHDYLSIPATTLEVKRTFSQGRLVLPHVRNCLSYQSTRASMCVGSWSSLGLVKDKDILDVLGEEVVEEEALPDGWDAIRGL
ncbi:hypothetical protein CVT26_015194 [Gymnopilus dilepis]|uniref:HAT C-terminal dimerisation domain-containing protein n=1 Tax=Gymnopilus dilepis TaxID=231916 RepID=A0A409WS12_9AGAR|nr:hypothetical protein CVT26_015194 [Gymnopilus dilepis]